MLHIAPTTDFKHTMEKHSRKQHRNHTPPDAATKKKKKKEKRKKPPWCSSLG
jgi:hypothetical protein